MDTKAKCLTMFLNPQLPKDIYMSYRTANLQMLHFIYYSTNIRTEYFKHAAHSPFFFFSKCRLFHNVTFFGSCVIHILYTGVLKFKKKKFRRQRVNRCIQRLQRDATLTAEWITLQNSTVAPGSLPNLHSTPADLKYLWLFFIRSTFLQLSLPPLGGPRTISAPATFWKRFAVDSNCQMSKCQVGNNLGKHRLHPAV